MLTFFLPITLALTSYSSFIDAASFGLLFVFLQILVPAPASVFWHYLSTLGQLLSIGVNDLVISFHMFIILGYLIILQIIFLNFGFSKDSLEFRISTN